MNGPEHVEITQIGRWSYRLRFFVDDTGRYLPCGIVVLGRVRARRRAKRMLAAHRRRKAREQNYLREVVR